MVHLQLGSLVLTHPWTTYWTAWFSVMAGTFLVPELYALFTNPANTLSANVWRMEGFVPGQSIAGWSFAHFAFTGVLILLFAWLIGHFGWGLWR